MGRRWAGEREGEPGWGHPGAGGRRWDCEKVPSALMHPGRPGWRCAKDVERAFTFPDALQRQMQFQGALSREGGLVPSSFLHRGGGRAAKPAPRGCFCLGLGWLDFVMCVCFSPPRLNLSPVFSCSGRRAGMIRCRVELSGPVARGCFNLQQRSLLPAVCSGAGG